MLPQVCPTDGELAEYSLGNLPVERLEQVASHVDGCTSCANRLDRLAGETDPLADAVRRAGQMPSYAAEPAPKALGEYRLEDVLGEGGMGTVYRAIHTRLGRAVALKLLTARRRLDPDAAARFEREMRAIGALRHPNIVQPTYADEIDGVPFLVMELLEGRDLARLVVERGKLPVPDACEATRQAALGLQHAHEHGLVHRDVKPSNLMLTPDGTVKLLDLGLARTAESEEAPDPAGATVVQLADLTATDMQVGTAKYMAPEQGTAPDKVDARADVYALGRTLCFLLTGSPELPAAGAVPGGLVKILQRLQAEKPEDRFASAEAAATALRPWCREHDLPALLGRKRRRRFRVRWALVPLVAVALAVVLRIFVIPSAIDWLNPTQTVEEVSVPPPEPPPAGRLGMTAEDARTLQKLWAEYLRQDVAVPNSIEMNLVLIPPGQIVIKEVTTVVITRPYRLSATEVTRSQFRAFITATGYRPERLPGVYMYRAVTDKPFATLNPRVSAEFTWKSPGYEPLTENDPVSQVSWNDAVAFCKWLSEREGKTYRLPTLAELTWASRSGDANLYPGVPAGRADSSALEKSAWTYLNSPTRAQPVATLQSNAWGLFDTLGNVSEWCMDNDGPTPGGTHADFAGPEGSLLKVHHGGSYTTRFPYSGTQAGPPKQRTSAIGFRVLREP